MDAMVRRNACASSEVWSKLDSNSRPLKRFCFERLSADLARYSSQD
jgi:hypothetical protein